MIILYYYCIIVLFLVLPVNCKENKTKYSDIRDQSYAAMKYVAVILFSLLLLYGIISNGLFVLVICSRDNHYSRSFISIISQLIICNLIIFSLQVVYILPGILRTKGSSEGKLIYIHTIIRISFIPN